MEKRGIYHKAILLSDTGSISTNGVGKFNSVFESRLKSCYKEVIVFDYAQFLTWVNDLVICDEEFFDLFVNAYNSKCDTFVRKNNEKFKNNNIIFGRRVIISHGWTKVKFRWNLYSIYYFLKFQIARREKLSNVFSFYNEVLFISKAEDNYRHSDKVYVNRHGVPWSYYDFAKDYIDVVVKDAISFDVLKKGVLIIANNEPVKNIYSLFLPRFQIWKRQNGLNEVNLLCQSCRNSYLLKILCSIFKINLFTENRLKYKLLADCHLLYIPSHTEYQPLTALEAFAFGKQVVSKYKITSLINFSLYSFLRE